MQVVVNCLCVDESGDVGVAVLNCVDLGRRVVVQQLIYGALGERNPDGERTTWIFVMIETIEPAPWILTV